MMYSYLFPKQYRVKEYNSAYDSCFNMDQDNPVDIFTKQGWIYVTNEISKFDADIFVMKKLGSGIKYNIEKTK